MKKTWNLINEIRGKFKNEIKPLFKLGSNSKTTICKTIASKFNEYYASLAENMKNSVTDDIVTNGLKPPSFLSYMGKSQESSMFLIDCTDDEILELIRGLENGKASDVPIKLIKVSAPQIIKNIYIADHDEFVKSDHYAVNFSIDIRGAVKRLKPIKRSARNYTKANWENINDELANVNWTQNIDYTDIDTAWLNFRNILNKICDRHIPNVTIKNNTNYPWYDAEVLKINRKKERLRSRYKLSQNPEHYKKYSQARKQLKNTIKDKMRSKLFDNSNPRVLTKKFWSYVKSSSNSSRIPEHVYYEKVSAANSIKKANLFNDFFFNQFSESSKYDVDVNFSNREFHSFRFNILTVTNILKNIDVNKSPGPDGIAGIVLKKCASNLSHPLSILFDISFSTGQLPSDWKLANVVPVHKKGDKSNVENYRPISLTSLVMKVMEKYLRDELYDKCRQFISDKQHGFLP